MKSCREYHFLHKTKNPAKSWVPVRAKGLEPPRLSALDPKSSAATNYATPAGPYWDCKGRNIFYNCNTYPKKNYLIPVTSKNAMSHPA